MRFTKAVRKFNQIRKQNWSAPAVMSVFIVSCMLVVFSLETVGLLKREKNLEVRHRTTPVGVKPYDLYRSAFPLDGVAVRTASEKSERMKRILLAAAIEQIRYDGSFACSDCSEFLFV